MVRVLSRSFGEGIHHAENEARLAEKGSTTRAQGSGVPGKQVMQSVFAPSCFSQVGSCLCRGVQEENGTGQFLFSLERHLWECCLSGTHSKKHNNYSHCVPPKFYTSLFPNCLPLSCLPSFSPRAEQCPSGSIPATPAYL